MYLNYVGHFLILASTVTGCVSISAFASLVAIPVLNTSGLVTTFVLNTEINSREFCSKIKAS